MATFLLCSKQTPQRGLKTKALPLQKTFRLSPPRATKKTNITTSYTYFYYNLSLVETLHNLVCQMPLHVSGSRKVKVLLSV